jgi:drug/metabolite transporter (DMT)-like permease
MADMPDRRLSGHLLLTAAMITVGSTVVAAKLMATMPVFVAAFLRFLIAAPILAALAWWLGQRLPRLGRRDWAILALQAGLGSVGYSVLLMLSLAHAAAADAAIVAGSLPAITALVALVLLREPIGPRATFGILLAALGVGLVGWPGADAPADATALRDRLIGILLVGAAMVCEAIFLLLNKTVRAPVPPLMVSTLMAVLSLLFTAAPAVLQAISGAAPVVTGPGLAAAAYYALVPTVLGFWLWYAGAARVPAAEASLFTAVMPVSGLALSVLVLGEPLTPLRFAGAAIVVASVLIGATRSR